VVGVLEERSEHVAEQAIAAARRALEGASERLLEDHALTLDLLALAARSITLAQTALEDERNA
jgi:hypothetical protein